MLLNLESYIIITSLSLIGSTEHGPCLLQANLNSPLPSLEMVFLSTYVLVYTQLMANPNNNALNLLIVERLIELDKVKEILNYSISCYFPEQF
jgi:hypothetical protein